MYRNAWWDNKLKCIKLRTWDKNGIRISGSCTWKPYLFTESDSGQYKSIFGGKLEKREFETPFDRMKFTKDYGSKRYYGNFDVTQQFLIDTFWSKVSDPDFAKNELRIIFYDIEVDPLPDNQFPVPELAKAEINIITAWDSLEKKYFIFSKYPYNGNDLIEGSVFIHCENERELLIKFIEFWQSNDYPDIVSGWNSNGFDFPYIRNRIIKVLGDNYFLALSPYGVIKEFLTQDKLQREIIKYDVAGIANLDYLDVYAKFKVAKQESYKLDFIAEQEIGYGKVDYEGMTIYEFMAKHWDRFVEYNVRDVELLVKLEEKLRYFRILRIVSNMACVNYDKGLTTIPITNGALAIRAKARGEILHTFIREVSDEKKPGGFCFSTPGFHKDIVTVDATSLYPSIIMSNNISPETKVGMCYFHDTAVDMYIGHDEDVLDLELTNGKRYTISRENLKKLIKQKDLILSANGCLFSQDKEGIFPEFIRDVFSKRVEAKNLMKKLQKENEKLEKKLEKLKKQLNEKES